MSYDNNIEKPAQHSDIAVALTLKRTLDSSVFTFGTPVTFNLPYGDVTGVKRILSTYSPATNYPLNMKDLTKVPDVSVVGNDTFSFDVATKDLVIKMGSEEPFIDTVIIEFQVFWATDVIYMPKDPTAGGDNFEFNPYLLSGPQITNFSRDEDFDVLPVSASSIDVILNSDTRHLLYDVSFAKKPIEIYHVIRSDLNDTYSATNDYKKVYSGLTSNFNYDQQKLTIKLQDANDVLYNEFRFASEDNFITLSDFPDLDPQYTNKPFRAVYGEAKRIPLIHTDFDNGLDNFEYQRSYLVSRNISEFTSGQKSSAFDKTVTILNTSFVLDAFSNPTGEITASFSSADANKLKLYDVLTIEQPGGSKSTAYIVTPPVGNVFTLRGFVDNTATSGEYEFDWGGSASTTVGTWNTSAERSFCRDIVLIRNQSWDGQAAQNWTRLAYATDTHTPATGYPYFKEVYDSDKLAIEVYPNQSLTNGNPIQNEDLIVSTVDGERYNASSYGNNSLFTNLSGSNQSSTMPATGMSSLSHVLSIIMLQAGFTTDTFDFANLSAFDNKVGFTLPFNTQDASFPQIKDILTEITKSSFFRFYYDTSQKKLSYRKIALNNGFNQDVILDDYDTSNVGYRHNYQNIISDIILDYDKSEYSKNTINKDDNYLSEKFESGIAIELHDTKKQKTFKTLLKEPAEVSTLLNTYVSFFTDRQGNYTIRTDISKANVEIGDKIQLTGNDVLGEQTQINGRVTGFLKTDKFVRIDFSDNKGLNG